MINAGIDCGAKNTKTVLLKDGEIIGKAKVLTGFDQIKAVETSLAKSMEDARIKREEVARIVGTGSGRNAIKMAESKINVIKAMGKGTHFFFPNARTVGDVGAEGSRTAKLDENGDIEDFDINEKCAAGAGAFIEAMSRALEISIEEMGLLALKSDREIIINAQCAIFAESEVVGLIHAEAEMQDISKAIHDAMASRIVSMIRRIGVNKDVAMIGGVAYSPAFVEAIKRELKLENVYVPQFPDYAGAVGAATVAAEESA
ncbi:MAG: acyl-CoA dehydratase activase [Desulfobacteraceae bacterium]|jgi:benzoyl-CoA reductase subunit D